MKGDRWWPRAGQVTTGPIVKAPYCTPPIPGTARAWLSFTRTGQQVAAAHCLVVKMPSSRVGFPGTGLVVLDVTRRLEHRHLPELVIESIA
jgi:hypothetical protein